MKAGKVMADAKDLLEKIKGLLGNEAADVAKQHLEMSAQLEKAKIELADIETKKSQAASDAEGQVSGLTTRQAEIEKRENEIQARETAVEIGIATHEQTSKNLSLREQALIPQEEAVRARGLDLTTKEAEIVKDATDLASLRDDLLQNAQDQQIRHTELDAKEKVLNDLKESLKTIQTEPKAK